MLCRLIADGRATGQTIDAVLGEFGVIRYPRAKRVYDASLQICQWEQLVSYDRSLMQKLMGETHMFMAGPF